MSPRVLCELVARAFTQFTVGPHTHRENAEGECEVGGESVRADTHALNESTLHHIPTERTLSKREEAGGR